MSYHKFSNLRETFQKDLTKKTMNGIESKDFENKGCKCFEKTKVNGECLYGEECSKCCVIYKATCKCCNVFYIGCTQNKTKV